MKTLMLNYEFPPLGGGASPVSYEMAKGYVKNGQKVDVVTMSFKNLPSFEQKDGINIYRVKSWRSKKEICHPWEQLTYIISAAFFLKKHLKNNTYDICHCHFLIPTGIVALWVKKKYGLSYIITAHGSDVPGYNPDRFNFLHKFTKPILKKVILEAKTVVSPSSYLANLIKKNIENIDIKIIPYGFYADNFTPKPKKKIILSTGRLLPRKGFQYLIKAVSKNDVGYEVHIAGDGPMMAELKEMARKSKTKIIFHGWLDNKSREYKKLLEESSIYSLVSEKENFSVSLLEAMSAGCAVVTSNVSGCPESVGEAGITVNPKDIKQLREKIWYLTRHPAEIENLGKKARKRVVEHFDWEKIIREYEKLISS